VRRAWVCICACVYVYVHVYLYVDVHVCMCCAYQRTSIYQTNQTQGKAKLVMQLQTYAETKEILQDLMTKRDTNGLNCYDVAPSELIRSVLRKEVCLPTYLQYFFV
jgi:hypothetical protein